MWSRRSRTRGDTGAGAPSLVLSIQGMHCGSCGLSIDDAAEDVPGVVRATTSFRTSRTEITLADGANGEEVAGAVVEAIAAAGYTAQIASGSGP